MDSGRKYIHPPGKWYMHAARTIGHLGVLECFQGMDVGLEWESFIVSCGCVVVFSVLFFVLSGPFFHLLLSVLIHVVSTGSSGPSQCFVRVVLPLSSAIMSVGYPLVLLGLLSKCWRFGCVYFWLSNYVCYCFM